VYCVIDVQPVRSGHPVGRVARTGFWLSLFRFQGATGHIPVLPVVVPGARRTVPDRLLRWRVSFGGQKASRGRSDGMHTVSDRPSRRQRVDCRRDETAPGGCQEGCVAGSPCPQNLPAGHPGASTQATWTRYGHDILPGEPCRTRGSFPRVTAGSRFHAKIQVMLSGDGPPLPGYGPQPPPTPAVACEEPPGPLARHPAFEAQRTFRSSPPIALGPPGGSVRCPLISSIYRSCTNFHKC
jgi:hypothetical protein